MGDNSSVSDARGGEDVGGTTAERLHAADPAFQKPRSNRFVADDGGIAEPADALTAQLKDPDPDVRAEAAEALGLLGHGDAVSALRAQLKDADGEVRTSAAVALIRIGDEALFPEVVKALRHADRRVVIGAAVTLGRLADPRVVPNLVEAFKTQDREVGAAVAWALGQCRDRAALPWLLAALEQGFAAANVCEALGRIGDARARPALLGALRSEAADTRAYAARALSLLDGPPVGQERARLVSALRRGLKDPSRKVRLCAAIALYELGESLGEMRSLAEIAGE